MEIRDLNLVAFGPFTDRMLEFSSDEGGLHIVYGPNEAGKSSSLRGLKALLFGIPSRTTDNFLHDNKDLRIAGRLHGDSGEVLEIVRRKGNKNTLLSPDGDQLDDAVLTPFLQGVNAEIFETMFGIDHEALVLGGQEILKQKGEVGQALFAASIGSASLHTILEQLESEADALFKARGSTQDINADLKKYAELQKAIKEQSLSSKDWADGHRALERTNKDLARVLDEITQCKVERNRLKRIQRALPKIVERRELIDQLEALGPVVTLSDDFGKRREKAALGLETALATVNSVSGNLSDLQEQVADITVNAEVLEVGEIIEDLHARLGGHRKAMQDRPLLKAERAQLLNDAEALLKLVHPELPLADVETLRPVLSKRVRITELGSERKALTQSVSQAKKGVRENESQLQKAKTSIEALGGLYSAEALNKQVGLGRKLGDLDTAIQSGRENLDILEKACLDQLSRQHATWQGALEDILGLNLPIRESIDRFEQAFTTLDQRTQRLGEKQDGYTDKLREAKKQLDEIQYAGAVPTEEDLLDARSGRDQAWKLLRRQWLNGEAVEVEARELDAERALPEVYESRVVDADELGDRLRREAERVQKQANLLATQSASDSSIKDGDAKLEACMKDKLQLDVEWTDLWKASDIQPLSPREMRTWLADMEQLRERVDELDQQRRQVNELKNARALQIQALQEKLKNVDIVASETASLEELLAECEAVVTRLDNLCSQHQTLEKTIESLEQEQESTQLEQHDAIEALDEWKAQWQEAVRNLGLGSDALPAEASDMLESIKSLFSKLTEAENLKIRIDGIDEDADRFRAEVASVVDRVVPEFAQFPVEEAVTRLTHLLKDTRTDDTKQDQLEKQISDAQQNIKAAKASKKTMNERLDSLCKEAQCDETADLEAAECNSTEFKTLKHSIGVQERELREIGEGLSLEDLEIEADTADPDTLPGEIEALTEQIDKELGPQQTDLAVAKGEQQNELSLMDGSDEAAALAEKAQSVLERVRSNAGNYVRLKLASRILRNEIERYRQENQGPLLERASEHFAVLTRGSFAGLQTDFDEKDEPILVGVRPDDARVFVDGMSSGTRDQLYLALRLASLEKYVESAETMPFIVDDILVHFDDERSKATLGVLAELSNKTQIILFTHHHRLIEQARELGATVPLTVHEL